MQFVGNQHQEQLMEPNIVGATLVLTQIEHDGVLADVCKNIPKLYGRLESLYFF